MRADLSKRRNLAALGLVAVIGAGASTYALVNDDTTPDKPQRQAEVARKGRAVMPFDLDRSTHRFTKTRNGGVQTVVADNAADQAQIRLIREHLRKELAGFRQGDFSDPATIHGSDMPGLKELSRGHKRIQVGYRDAPTGAQITFVTGDAALAKALHAWFDAQVSDHGAHAQHG